MNRNKEGRVEPRYYLPDEVINGLENKWTIPVLNSGDTPTTYESFEDAKEAAAAAGLALAAAGAFVIAKKRK